MPAWHLHLDVVVILGTVGAIYVWLARKVGPSKVEAVERPVTRRQALAFAAGLGTFFIASIWPIHDIAETELYSVHMVQHMLYSLVAPPLILLGIPAWMMRLVLGPRGIAVAKVLGRPMVALVAFNVIVAVTHIPMVVDVSTRSEPFHLLVHVAVVGTALMMWSPVLNPLIELPKLSYPGRMVYLFLQSLVPTVPASFLTFGDTVLYGAYDVAPALWGVTAITDQRMAGLIMKLAAGFLLWAVIAYYFFKWFSVEQRERVDVLEWGKPFRGGASGASRSQGAPTAYP